MLEDPDLYSLASTMFTILAGEAPYVRPGEESLAPLLARIATEPVPDLRSKGMPEALCGALERALAKDPKARHSGAVEFARHLQAVQEETGMARTPLPLEGEDRNVITDRSTRSRPLEPTFEHDELERTPLQPAPSSVRPERRGVWTIVGRRSREKVTAGANEAGRRDQHSDAERSRLQVRRRPGTRRWLVGAGAAASILAGAVFLVSIAADVPEGAGEDASTEILGEEEDDIFNPRELGLRIGEPIPNDLERKLLMALPDTVKQVRGCSIQTGSSLVDLLTIGDTPERAERGIDLGEAIVQCSLRESSQFADDTSITYYLLADQLELNTAYDLGLEAKSVVAAGEPCSALNSSGEGTYTLPTSSDAIAGRLACGVRPERRSRAGVEGGGIFYMWTVDETNTLVYMDLPAGEDAPSAFAAWQGAV